MRTPTAALATCTVARALSVNACLKSVPALTLLALPSAGTAATVVPGAGDDAAATAASDAVLSTAGATAGVALFGASAGAAAAAGDLSLAGTAAPSSGAALCLGDGLSAGDGEPCRRNKVR